MNDLTIIGPFVVGVVVLLGLGRLIENVLGIQKHGSEPPFIPSKVPYFSHLYFIIRRGVSYYAILTAQYQKKIYSLAMPGGRLYVVNSPELIGTIQKVPRVLSFWFIEASLTKNLGGISDEANAILLDNARGDKGSNSLVVDGMKATHQAMVGEHLEILTAQAVQRAEKELLLLETSGMDNVLDLWEWTQHVFSMAVSRAIYGPSNPYEDLMVERGLVEFSDHTVTFLTGLPPWIFVRKAYKARERIVSAFHRFFAEKSDEKASQLVQVRAKVLRDYGIPEADVARFETVNGFGILLNLLPTAFWTLFHVLADPQLLELVREEAKAALGPQKTDAVLGEELDLTAADCLPTLSSILMESLRYHTAGAAVRMVMEDHMLDGEFLLKKDNYVLIPNRGAHFDTEAWGANVNEFDAYRFDKRRGAKVHPTAFRGFGGGVNLCPGRAFASRIIVLIVASLVQRFDVQPVTKSGEWEDPGRDETSMAIVLARPKEKVMVRLVPREA